MRGISTEHYKSAISLHLCIKDKFASFIVKKKSTNQEAGQYNRSSP